MNSLFKQCLQCLQLIPKEDYFLDIYILSSFRQSRFPVPPFKSLSKLYTSSLKVGYLLGSQSSPSECCISVIHKTQQAEKWPTSLLHFFPRNTDYFFPPSRELTVAIQSQVRQRESPIWKRGCSQQCYQQPVDITILCWSFSIFVCM